MTAVELFASFGRSTVPWLWIPLTAWTLAAGALLVPLRLARGLDPLIRYRLSQAMLMALPFAVGFGPWLGRLVPAPSLVPGLGTPFVDVEDLGAVSATSGVTHAQLDGLGVLLGGATLWVALLAALSSIALAKRFLELRRLDALAIPATDPATRRILRDLKRQLGVRRPVTLLEGPPGTVPLTFGWIQPAIVIDGRFRLAPDRLRIALAHELIHVRRADAAWAVVESIVTALAAAHPLVRMIARDVHHHRETSCDAELVASGVAPLPVYVRLLYDVGLGPAPLLAPGLLARPSTLKKRLETMKRFANAPRSPRVRPMSAAAAIVLFAALVASGACGRHADPPPAPEVDVAQQLTSRFGPMADETRDAALERLDVQMSYLTERVEGMAERIEEAQASGRDVAPHVYEQYGLLNRMYLERLETYETLKLERETELRLGRSVHKQ